MTPTPRRPRTRRREIVIFTEGEATEVGYFDAIKRLQNQFVVRVDDRHGTPQDLVALAIEVKRDRDRQAQQESQPMDERAQFWCVFDRDDHVGVDAAIGRARSHGIRVAFSHPCFELWLLLHFQAYGAPTAGSCRSVTTAVCGYLPEYKKRGKRVMLGDVAGRYDTARDRALQLGRQHDRDGLSIPSQRDPSTDVFELLDAIAVRY